jgi:hypothetical protein
VTTPTPADTMAAGSSATSVSSPGASPVAVFAAEILGVVVLTILAGIGPRIGRIVLFFMVGILILWLILNASTLKNLIPGTNVAVQG